MSDTNAKKIFVLGGVRSGKSRFAAELAESISPDGNINLIVTADSSTADRGMQRRIEQHQSERSENWSTTEEPVEVANSLCRINGAIAIVDCLTVWLSNLLAKCGDAEAPDFYERVEAVVQPALGGLSAAITETDRSIILIANDVGSGVSPPTQIGNVFADMQGLVNQRVASACGEVYLMTAGIQNRIK